MKNRLIYLLRWVVNALGNVLFFLENHTRKINKDECSKFVHLAPTDEADEENVYSKAILYALNEDDVLNIALTGPYGSGKSSVIRSFLKRHPLTTLNISLAAFVPEIDSPNSKDKCSKEKVTRQEVERSILQQMLYGADANRLPLSRFKRIKSPGLWSLLKSFYIATGIAAVGYLYVKRESIFSGVFFEPLSVENWINYVVLIYAASFFWAVLHSFYVASFGLSLKSVSLKDVEIKPDNEDESSILNRHIDEIIYFFQSTSYELVVIEDLDRFEEPEIFVTLREINSLVNKNVGVKRKIKFLYALRDDIFVSAERTKFFEFIIPVIPIVNSSNSIDMMLKQGARLKLDKPLDMQFLREVSRYLNDLRLIQNIFNEYAIYSDKLEKTLDSNKLLAILIYKNVYPRDFENLHRGSGNLAEVFSSRDKLIKSGEALFIEKIKALEQQIEKAEQQIPLDLKELRQIYSMIIVEHIPTQHAATSLSHDGQNFIVLSELAGHEAFEEMITASQIYTRNSYNQRAQIFSVSKSKNNENLGSEYQRRKVEIEKKFHDNKKSNLSEINKLKNEVTAIRKTKLKELLRIDADKTQEVFERFGDNGELARFLILEGYLDDTYYQYTSLFHSGRLSPSDNKFLISIRAFITPEPDFVLDNVDEVIAAMRAEDFEHSYVLNIKIVDALVLNKSSYSKERKNLFKYLSANFDNCEDFFEAYYERGGYVCELLSGLASVWKDLLVKALKSPNSILHTTQLIRNLPETLLSEMADKSSDLRNVVSDNLSEIMARAPDLSPQRLVLIKAEVKDFAGIREHSDTVRVMFEKGLFYLTIENLDYICQVILGNSDLETMHNKNYSAIKSSNSPVLINKVENNFEFYMRNVLLKLEGNSKEDVSTIVDVVGRVELNDDLAESFIAKQVNKIPRLEEVPEVRYEMLFRRNCIEPSWENCLVFIKSEVFDKNILMKYLDLKEVVRTIVKQSVPAGDDYLTLRRFIYNADGLVDEHYRKYMRTLPKSFKSFSDEVSFSKLKILINESKVVFSQASIEELADERELQLLFVEKNIEDYLARPDEFELDDVFLEELLEKSISDKNKLKIINLMDLEVLENFPSRAGTVGSLIDRLCTDLLEISESSTRALIVCSNPLKTKISLFNKYQVNIDDNAVLSILSKLPHPYSQINYGHQKPILENTKENVELASWLDSRNIISSWTPPKSQSEPIRLYLYKNRK